MHSATHFWCHTNLLAWFAQTIDCQLLKRQSQKQWHSPSYFDSAQLHRQKWNMQAFSDQNESRRSRFDCTTKSCTQHNFNSEGLPAKRLFNVWLIRNQSEILTGKKNRFSLTWLWLFIFLFRCSDFSKQPIHLMMQINIKNQNWTPQNWK